jgi:hypothetical protein
MQIGGKRMGRKLLFSSNSGLFSLFVIAFVIAFVIE